MTVRSVLYLTRCVNVITVDAMEPKQVSAILFICATSLGSSACTFDQSGLSPPVQLRDRLATPEHLVLVPDACFLEVNQKAIPLTGGSIDVQADLIGELQLDATDIHLGDIDVPPTADRPVELHFTDVKLALPKPIAAATEWSAAGDAGFTHIDTDVQLIWSLVTKDGQVIPLAPQNIKKVPLEIDVFEAGNGRLTSTVHGEIQGPFYDWAGILEMSDLTVDLRAEI
jgi:hypothetical protein